MKKTTIKPYIVTFFLIVIIIVAAFGAVGISESNRNKEVRDLYLYMEKDVLEHLYYYRCASSNERVPGYVKLSPWGRNIELEGLKFRGTSSRFLPKKSFDLLFAEEQDFVFGNRHMLLRATYTDPTMLREKLSMDMFLDIGRPAPRTRYFNLYINNNYEGLYVQVERVDEKFLSHSGLNPEGTLVIDKFRLNMFKPEINRLSLFGYKIDGIEDPQTFLSGNFWSRGNPDWGSLVEFASWVYYTPAGPQFASGFKERFDLDSYTDWLAVHFLIGDIDSFGDDYWLYKDNNEEAKWQIIPWDKDLSFGSHFRPNIGTDNDFFAYEYPLSAGWDNMMAKKFLATEELRDALYIKMEHLMNNVFTMEYFQDRIPRLAAVVEESINIMPARNRFVLHPGNHHGEPGRFPYHIETLFDFIELRYQFINRQINPVPGTAYSAVVDLREYDKNDTVFFTDPHGWVIAKMEIDDLVNPGLVKVVVGPQAGLTGIDRVWTVEAVEAEVVGRLTLYYRNDFVPDYGKDNWFEELKPVGGEKYSQWNLTMSEYNQAVISPMPSYVNPYSNKVSARVALNGRQQFVLIDPEAAK